MNCPRCQRRPPRGEGPYRSAVPSPVPVAMAERLHAETKLPLHVCPACFGVFASDATLRAIDAIGYERRSKVGALEMMRRGAAPPTSKVRCPACDGETTRKEWSFNTLVFVDVCIECRGVWLDAGELEAIEGTS